VKAKLYIIISLLLTASLLPQQALAAEAVAFRIAYFYGHDMNDSV